MTSRIRAWWCWLAHEDHARIVRLGRFAGAVMNAQWVCDKCGRRWTQKV